MSSKRECEVCGDAQPIHRFPDTSRPFLSGCNMNVQHEACGRICNECTRTEIEVRVCIGQGPDGISQLRCLDCDAEYQQSDIQARGGTIEIAIRFQRLLDRESAKANPLGRICPFCRRLQEFTDTTATRYECRHCTRSCCFQCRAPWHDQTTCAQEQMNQSQEIGQVLGDEVRACPGCGQRTWRAGDGDHITCMNPRCGWQFCFYCKVPYYLMTLYGGRSHDDCCPLSKISEFVPQFPRTQEVQNIQHRRRGIAIPDPEPLYRDLIGAPSSEDIPTLYGYLSPQEPKLLRRYPRNIIRTGFNSALLREWVGDRLTQMPTIIGPPDRSIPITPEVMARIWTPNRIMANELRQQGYRPSAREWGRQEQAARGEIVDPS